MRNLVHGAVIRATGLLDRAMGSIVNADADSADEQLARYTTLHRGRPEATLDFATRYSPPGSNPMVEAHDYERTMEEALRARGFPA